MSNKRKAQIASARGHVAPYSVVREWSVWGVITFAVLASIALSLYYKSVPVPIRILCWLAEIPVLMMVAYQSQVGKTFFVFSREAYGELLKVVWPTRQETTQMTLIVAVIVVVTSVVLWGV